MSKFEKVGSFTVKSEIFVISDALSVLNRNNAECIKDVSSKIQNESKEVKFSNGKDGLAIVGHTHLGIGSFSVYERILKNGSKQVLIKFQ